MKKRNILNKMLSVILIMGLLAAMMSGCGTKSEDKGSQKT